MALTVADRQEILELMSRYNHAIDSGDSAAFAALFTADGEWNGPGGEIRGTEALRGMIGDYADHPDVRPSQHWVSAQVVEGSGDSATASAYSMCATPTEDGAGIELELIGRYADTFKKVDGSWLFLRRQVGDVFPAAVNDFDLQEASS
jgi:uncharacterized protein (TIGR02246 family)